MRVERVGVERVRDEVGVDRQVGDDEDLRGRLDLEREVAVVVELERVGAPLMRT